jgi:hypothetical protein
VNSTAFARRSRAQLCPRKTATGEAALDLGSDAGVDWLIAARAVGPSGEVNTADMMTPEKIRSASHRATTLD